MYHFFLKQIKNKQVKENQKTGSEAVGAAISTMFFMLLFLVPIGLFIYIFPRLVLDQDVQQFANSIRLDGYVSSSVYEGFSERLMERGYTEDEIEDGVSAYVIDSPHALEDTRYSDGASLIQTDNYNPPIIERGKGQIVIQIELPANSGVFLRALSKIGGEPEAPANTYKVGRIIMSEAYETGG